MACSSMPLVCVGWLIFECVLLRRRHKVRPAPPSYSAVSGSQCLRVRVLCLHILHHQSYLSPSSQYANKKTSSDSSSVLAIEAFSTV
eukprot:scaffold120_cov176-Alexandrium_tamarense.AAC.8